MDIRMRKYAELLLKCVKAEEKNYVFIDIPTFLSDFKEVLLDCGVFKFGNKLEEIDLFIENLKK